MAAGTPVVSVAEMGTKNVLKEGLGVRITDGSAQDFASKITEVIDNPKLYAELAQSAITYASEWDSLSLAQKLNDYYVEIVQTKHLDRPISVEQF